LSQQSLSSQEPLHDCRGSYWVVRRHRCLYPIANQSEPRQSWSGSCDGIEIALGCRRPAVDGASAPCAIIKTYPHVWRTTIDGEFRDVGDDLHLRTCSTHLRAEKTSGAREDLGKGHDRIPARVQ